MSKQLTCPGCGDVVADAVYRPWAGSLTLTSTEGHQITPLGWDIAQRLIQQEVASAAAEDLEQPQARLEFLNRHLGELIYDFRCCRGHSTLRTGPQIARALRRTPGRWVSLR